MTILFIEGERKEQMQQHYEMTLLRKETHVILENLTEGVITKSSKHGLKHFNQAGLSILKQGIDLTADKE